MFDVGFWELTFLATLALLVLGPDKLPGVVNTVGRMLGRARGLARSLKMQMEREMHQSTGGHFSTPGKSYDIGGGRPAQGNADESQAAAPDDHQPGSSAESAEGHDPRSTETETPAGSADDEKSTTGR